MEIQSGRSKRVDRDLTVAKAPPHGTWPKALKSFLLIRYATRHLFPRFRTTQASWELLLTTNYENGRYPGGRMIQMGVNPSEVFDLAVSDAEKWKADGAKAEFL